MVEPVKGTSSGGEQPLSGSRSYVSPLRQQQAEATRVAICESAGRLFERDGYARTTITAIADDAGVSPETIYGSFGNKRQVLWAVFEHTVSAGGRSPAMLEGDWLDEVVAEPDARRRLALMSKRTRGVLDRSGALHEVVRLAARTDPNLAELEVELDDRRRRDVEGLVGMLAEVATLRMPVDDAIDVVWAIAVSDLYLRLRRGCEWSSDRADAFVEDLIARVVLS